MAIPIEGTTIVVRLPLIDPLIKDGKIVAPNSTCLQDEHLWRCSFMEDREAQVFLGLLSKAGLNVTQGPDPDAVMVDEYDQKINPYCEWLSLGAWEKAVIAWKSGTTPDKVVAREGWNPSVGSSLRRLSEEELKRDYVHESTKDGIDAYVHRVTGVRIYLGRSNLSPERRFKEASDVVLKAGLAIGQEPLAGPAAQELLEAEKNLEALVSDNPAWWASWWMLGKARQRRGQLESARDAYRKAVETSGNDIRCLRELGGVCLELGDFAEAVDASTKAIIVEPDNHELIANQAISFLLADRIPDAAKAIASAVRMSPQDEINRHIKKLIDQVVSGQRERPKTLQEAMRPGPSRNLNNRKEDRRPWWKFW